MAEAYRGLTIRIGADTTKLRSAMSDLRHASHSLQTDFRKLSRALNIDPSNYRLAQASIRTMGNYMQTTAAEAGRLNRALRQIGSQKGYGDTTQTIRQLSNHTKNAQLEAVRAKEAYNGLDKQLEQVYRAVAKYRSSQKNLNSGTYKQEYDAVRELAHRWKDATAQKKLYRQIRTAVQNGENPWNLSGTGEKLLQQYRTVFTRIRNEWKKTEERLGRANQVVGFQNIRNDAELAMAKIRELSMEFTKLRSAQLRLGTGEVKKLAGEIDRLSNDAKTAENRMNKLDEALRMDPHNIDAARQKMIALGERTDATSRALEKAEQRLKAMNQQGFQRAVADAEKLGKSAEEIKNGFTEANAKVEKLSGELDEARVHAQKLKSDGEGTSKEYADTRAEIKRLEKALEKAKNEAKKLNEQFEVTEKSNAYKEQAADIELMRARLNAYNREQQEARQLARINAGRALRSAGYASMSTITPMLMMGGMYMVQAADEVDAAYRNMRKTVNGTEEEFEALRDAAMDFASTHVTSTDQMLEIEAIGGQLGIAVENLEAFGETVANLDVATNMNTEDIAADLGKMGSVLGMTSSDYDNFGDALVRLGNNFPAFESDIMTITTRFMGIGKVVGMTAPEMLAWATAATATGQKAEAAGSSMQRFISFMETAAVNGGENLETIARVAGMTADEFSAKFEQDASAAMYDFIYGLGEMQRSGESVNQVLGDLGINNVRDKQLLEGLANQMANSAGNTNLLNDALTASQDAWNGVSDEWGAAGDAAFEAQKKAEGFSGQLQILKNNGQILGVVLADGIAPILQKVNEIVQTFTAVFAALPDGTKTALIGILGLTAAFGPMLVLMGSTMTTMSNLNRQLNMMGGAWEKTVKHTRNSKGQLQTVTSYYDRLGNQVTQTTTAVNKGSKGMEYVTKTAKKAAPALTMMGNAARLAATSFGPMLAIAVVAIAIGKAVQKFDDLKEHEEKVQHATKDLVAATNSLGSEFGRLPGRIQAASRSVKDINEDSQEFLDSLGEHADNIQDTADEANITVGQLEHAWDIINKASTDQDWGRDNIGQVAAACEIVTEQTGYQLDAQRLINGEYENELDYIKRIIDVKKQLTELEAARQIIIETEVAQQKAETEYEEAYKEYMELYNELRPDENRLYGEDKGRMEAAEERLHTAEEAVVSAGEAADAAYSKYDELAENYVSTAESIISVLKDESFDMFEGVDADHLAELGTSYEEVAEAFERLGVSAYDLSQMDPSDVAHLIEVLADKGEEGLAEELDNMGIGFEHAAQGVDEFRTATLTLGSGETYVYQVTDDGTIYREGQKIEGFQAYQIDGKWYAVSDDGTIYDETHRLDDLEAKEIRDKIFAIKADATAAQRTMNAVVNWTGATTIRINANTAFLGKQLIDFFDTHTYNANIRANVKFGGNAAGGLIPAHAAGGFNGIVTKPLFTNQGLVGEAGAEAVMRWAGGTAIVPLQNRQYVRPFARTVAEEIPMAFGSYGGVTAGEIAAALAQLNLQVRMDSGELVGVLVSNSQRRAAMNVG